MLELVLVLVVCTALRINFCSCGLRLHSAQASQTEDRAAEKSSSAPNGILLTFVDEKKICQFCMNCLK